MFSPISKKGLLPSVNFHLWQPCNMRCHFCFATFNDVKQSVLPKGHLPEKEAIKVLECLCRSGVEKITFAGGEPMLCPWLPSLLKVAKSFAVTTMIVTNGTKLTRYWLDEFANLIDWIAFSVDSLEPKTNALTGRKIPSGQAPDFEWYLEKANLIKEANIRFKVNTVVHRYNADEDLTSFIKFTEPERWKLFQVLPVTGQNDDRIEQLLISADTFNGFVNRHKSFLPNTIIVEESNEAMTGSYLMVDPAGRFFDNTKGRHTYSRKILEVGIKTALQDIHFDQEKFIARGGIYEW